MIFKKNAFIILIIITTALVGFIQKTFASTNIKMKNTKKPLFQPNIFFARELVTKKTINLSKQCPPCPPLRGARCKSRHKHEP